MKHLLILITVGLSFISKHLIAKNDTLKIDSIHITHQNCGVLGSLKIYASSDSLPLLYKLSPDSVFVETSEFNNLKAGGYTLVVKDGLKREITKNITINDTTPKVSINPVFEAICTNIDTFQLNANTKEGYWSGNGIDSITGKFSPKALGIGIFPFTFTHKTCTTSTVTENLLIREFADANILSDSIFCSNVDSILLNVAPSGGVWTGNGVNAQGWFFPAKVGVGTYPLQYEVAVGCVYKASKNFKVKKAVADISITHKYNGPYCAPVDLLFKTNEPSAVKQCTWKSEGERLSSSCYSGLFHFKKPGIKVVHFSVIDSANCEEEVTYTVKIGSFHNANFSWNKSKIFVGDSVLFSAKETNAVEYHWDFGDGNTAVGQKVKHAFKKKDFYTIFLEIVDTGNCSITKKKLIRVLEKNDDPDGNLGFEHGYFNDWNLFEGCHPNAIYRGANISDKYARFCHNDDGYGIGCCGLEGEFSDPNTKFDVWGARHTILTDDTATDKFTKEPVLAPYIEGFRPNNTTIRIGNVIVYGEADKLSKSFIITEENAIMAYRVSYVANDPIVNHQNEELPYFKAIIHDENNQHLSCSNLTLLANDSNLSVLTDIEVDTVNTVPPQGNMITVSHSSWQTVFVDLTDYIGMNVTLDFSVSDCARAGHWAYAYVSAYTNPYIPMKDTTICLGDNVVLKSPFPVSGFNLEWSTGDTKEQIVVYPSETTEYRLKVKGKVPYEMEQCEKEYKVTVTVATDSTFNLNFSSDKQQVKSLTPILFTPESLVLSNYLWDFGDGNTSTEPTPTHRYQKAGLYTVSLTGAIGTCEKTVIKTDYILVDSTVGVKEHPNLVLIKAFPNPVANELNLEIKLNEEDLLIVQVYDLLGNKKEEIELSLTNSNKLIAYKINTDAWENGIYFVSVNGKKTKGMVRILKQ